MVYRRTVLGGMAGVCGFALGRTGEVKTRAKAETDPNRLARAVENSPYSSARDGA